MNGDFDQDDDRLSNLEIQGNDGTVSIPVVIDDYCSCGAIINDGNHTEWFTPPNEHGVSWAICKDCQSDMDSFTDKETSLDAFLREHGFDPRQVYEKFQAIARRILERFKENKE